jgi:hypothetical protein
LNAITDIFKTLTQDERDELDQNNQEFFKLARKPDKTDSDYARMKELTARNKEITAWKGTN